VGLARCASSPVILLLFLYFFFCTQFTHFYYLRWSPVCVAVENSVQRFYSVLFTFLFDVFSLVPLIHQLSYVLSTSVLRYEHTPETAEIQSSAPPEVACISLALMLWAPIVHPHPHPRRDSS
jgi:hypothetical protein